MHTNNVMVVPFAPDLKGFYFVTEAKVPDQLSEQFYITMQFTLPGSQNLVVQRNTRILVILSRVIP